MSVGAESKVGLISKMGIGTAVVSVIVERAANYLTDTSLLSLAWGGLKGLGYWLAQDISFPLWQVAGLSAMSLILLMLSVFTARALYRAEDRIHRYENPAYPRLSENAHAVIMAISGFLHNSIPAHERDIVDLLKTTPIPVEAGLDMLKAKRLVEVVYDDYGYQSWGLTAAGRSYVLNPENLARRAVCQ